MNTIEGVVHLRIIRKQIVIPAESLSGLFFKVRDSCVAFWHIHGVPFYIEISTVVPKSTAVFHLRILRQIKKGGSTYVRRGKKVFGNR